MQKIIEMNYQGDLVELKFMFPEMVVNSSGYDVLLTRDYEFLHQPEFSRFLFKVSDSGICLDTVEGLCSFLEKTEVFSKRWLSTVLNKGLSTSEAIKLLVYSKYSGKLLPFIIQNNDLEFLSDLLTASLSDRIKFSEKKGWGASLVSVLNLISKWFDEELRMSLNPKYRQVLSQVFSSFAKEEFKHIVYTGSDREDFLSVILCFKEGLYG